MLLHLGLILEVKLFDKGFELLAISVKLFKVLGVDVVLVVVLSDLFLSVKFLIIIVVISDSE